MCSVTVHPTVLLLGACVEATLEGFEESCEKKIHFASSGE